MCNLHDSCVLKIAVASDLHAYQHIDGKPLESYLNVLGTTDSASNDPLQHLSNLITHEQLKADLFLSPGDLGNKASVEGIRYAWKSLHEIGDKLQAHLVTAASGNHDLDSRFQNYKYDPTEILQRLIPPYPLPNQVNNDQYWARKFALIQTEHYRLIVLNSAAYHGGQEDEINHGRISNLTIERIAEELSKSDIAPVNIILCHHHPQQFPEIFEDDDTYDIMKNGQQLLNLIGNGEHGNWIVIHGHKHHARVAYSQGYNSAPLVIAAGSFSAVIHPKLQTQARNQFYLLELPLDHQNGFVGTIRAWDWSPAGWSPAMPSGSGLPAVCKFGCRDAAQNLAGKINKILGNDQVANWSSILQEIPELDFLLPSDFKALVHALNNKKFNINVEFDNGIPKEIGRRQTI
ncbi:metallophosphoesterase [Methylomonas sp. SURF-2]|uniref:Metallophosphoesterase n=1 Tax=Methylomonas subterranea TaxID=2952225 RepID=A0ABT1TGK5_9GAMM|nr:metallophosphoesterase [Methylomonas sp. SURF-2]MCQ8104373.1 metallophosphoesterase [Methylomonas sp. SURF-2]